MCCGFLCCSVDFAFKTCAQAAQIGCHVWLKRVKSKDNISDLPSREDYKLMREIGATWRAPVIASLFIEK